MFPDPVSDLHMVWMRSFGKTGSLRLLGREETLFGPGRFRKASPPRITLGMNAFVSAIQPHHHSQRTPAKKLVPT
jgi:hypothetical protein